MTANIGFSVLKAFAILPSILVTDAIDVSDVKFTPAKDRNLDFYPPFLILEF